MKRSTLAAILIFMTFLCCLSNNMTAAENNIITKDSISKICPKLQVEKQINNSGTLFVKITIPADELRFKNLFQAWFIISKEDPKTYLRLPIKIYETDGIRWITIDASPNMLQNAVIELDCKYENPSRNSLDTLILELSSLLGLADDQKK